MELVHPRVCDHGPASLWDWLGPLLTQTWIGAAGPRSASVRMQRTRRCCTMLRNGCATYPRFLQHRARIRNAKLI